VDDFLKANSGQAVVVQSGSTITLEAAGLPASLIVMVMQEKNKVVLSIRCVFRSCPSRFQCYHKLVT
jgi:hypothetical protein